MDLSEDPLFLLHLSFGYFLRIFKSTQFVFNDAYWLLMLLLHSLSGLVVQWFSVTGKETKGESGSAFGRATWLVHNRRENKQHCF